MGRSIESVRMGAKEVSQRWTKAGRAMKREDQVYAGQLAEMARRHSSEAFYALDDPLEAAVFSVLVEMMREMDEIRAGLGELPVEGDGGGAGEGEGRKHDARRQ